METSWNGYGATMSTAPGPQVNLPTVNNTGWLINAVNGNDGVNQKGADWSEVGGAHTPDFVTFGILIRGDDLWFYANKPNGDQWYCIGPITKSNTTYEQAGPFVPYIGTWNNGSPSPGDVIPDGEFVTGYKNFVYVAESDAKIAGFNPKDNPEKFGPALSAGADQDGDGIANLMEYVLDGGDPVVPSLAILPTLSSVGDNFVLSYSRRDASEADTTQIGQWSTDLASWNDVEPVVVNENGPLADDMTVTVPKSNAENGKLFFRFKVTMP